MTVCLAASAAVRLSNTAGLAAGLGHRAGRGHVGLASNQAARLFRPDLPPEYATQEPLATGVVAVTDAGTGLVGGHTPWRLRSPAEAEPLNSLDKGAAAVYSLSSVRVGHTRGRSLPHQPQGSLSAPSSPALACAPFARALPRR